MKWPWNGLISLQVLIIWESESVGRQILFSGFGILSLDKSVLKNPTKQSQPPKLEQSLFGGITNCGKEIILWKLNVLFGYAWRKRSWLAIFWWRKVYQDQQFSFFVKAMKKLVNICSLIVFIIKRFGLRSSPSYRFLSISIFYRWRFCCYNGLNPFHVLNCFPCLLCGVSGEPATFWFLKISYSPKLELVLKYWVILMNFTELLQTKVQDWFMIPSALLGFLMGISMMHQKIFFVVRAWSSRWIHTIIFYWGWVMGMGAIVEPN